MTVDSKYGKITAERGDVARGEGGVPLNDSDEPVFVLRAQDVLSVPTVLSYASHAARTGLPPEFVASVRDAADRMEEWQLENPDRTKLPD